MSTASGEEWEQPADLVHSLSAYRLLNVRMMLLSGIGQPYDPATERAWSAATTCYQTDVGVDGFFERRSSFQSVHRLRRARHDASTISTATISIIGRWDLSAAAISACAQTNGRPDRQRRRPRPARRAGAPSGRRRPRENYLSTASGGSAHGSLLQLSRRLSRPRSHL